jgi:hypothetical protein
MAYLKLGNKQRETAETNMNMQSSRSHAIFTLTVRQSIIPDEKMDVKPVTLVSKISFVDLSGSERLKRTQAVGDRKKEGIAINQGLLVLGKVVNALAENMSVKNRLILPPYRESKLTRLLQQSLGGNCKTVMIACISPSEHDLPETVNTLKYASRARSIKNICTVNVSNQALSANEAKLTRQIGLLQAELDYYKSLDKGRELLDEETERWKTFSNEADRLNLFLKQGLDSLGKMLSHFANKAPAVRAEHRNLLEVTAISLLLNESQEHITDASKLNSIHPDHVVMLAKNMVSLLQENVQHKDTLPVPTTVGASSSRTILERNQEDRQLMLKDMHDLLEEIMELRHSERQKNRTIRQLRRVVAELALQNKPMSSDFFSEEDLELFRRFGALTYRKKLTMESKK